MVGLALTSPLKQTKSYQVKLDDVPIHESQDLNLVKVGLEEVSILQKERKLLPHELVDAK